MSRQAAGGHEEPNVRSSSAATADTAGRATCMANLFSFVRRICVCVCVCVCPVRLSPCDHLRLSYMVYMPQKGARSLGLDWVCRSKPRE